MDRTFTTEDLIRAAVHKFGAPRGEKTVFVGGQGVRVHTEGERVLHLPNGATVKVTTDESGQVTHIEDDEQLHAIVRPQTFTYRIGTN